MMVSPRQIGKLLLICGLFHSASSLAKPGWAVGCPEGERTSPPSCLTVSYSNPSMPEHPSRDFLDLYNGCTFHMFLHVPVFQGNDDWVSLDPRQGGTLDLAKRQKLAFGGLIVFDTIRGVQCCTMSESCVEE